MWRRCEGAGAGRWRDGQFDVEIGKAGLLQVEGGVAGEVLRGEIEEGEVAEAGLVGVVGVVGAGDGGSGEEVLAGEVESDVGVGATGHLQVEDDVAAAEAEVADVGGVAVGLLRFAESDGVGDFVAVLIEAQIFEGGCGVGEDLGIDDGAGLAGAAR